MVDNFLPPPDIIGIARKDDNYSANEISLVGSLDNVNPETEDSGFLSGVRISSIVFIKALLDALLGISYEVAEDPAGPNDIENDEAVNVPIEGRTVKRNIKKTIDPVSKDSRIDQSKIGE